MVIGKIFYNLYYCNFYRNCDMPSGTENAPICTGNQENDYTKFQSWFDGSAYMFYNERTGKYICNGSTGDGEQLVAQGSFDSSKCLMEITIEKSETLALEDSELFFCEF